MPTPGSVYLIPTKVFLMLKLLLADDHRLFRQGLRELIERKTPHQVVAEATTGREVLALIPQTEPDLLLLDIQMPELDGIAVAREVAHRYPHIHIVMLTMYRTDEQLLGAIEAGAKGYLLKDSDAEEVIRVIERVAAGDSALDPSLTTQLFSAMRRQPREDAEGEALTARELDIVRLVAQGQDNRTIAQTLFLSEKTVGNRLSEIFQKLGVTNRTQAALVARERGLV
jgi:DNA-binding NarL/FixJ family response regulator